MARESVCEISKGVSDFGRWDRMDQLFTKSRAIIDLLTALPSNMDVSDCTMADVAWTVRDMLDELQTLAR